MREPTEHLIEKLARDAAPVKALPSPLVRAGVFVAVVLVVMCAAAFVAGRFDEALAALSGMPFAAAFAGALITGVCAVVAAVMLSIPGRSEAWMLLPLPGALLWLAGSGTQCYQAIEAFGWDARGAFASVACFEFIALAGLPVAAGLYVLLRRAVATNLAGVTAIAGLGAAMFAAALLQFFHPHSADPVDLASHIAAVIALMVVMMTFGRRALERT